MFYFLRNMEHLNIFYFYKHWYNRYNHEHIKLDPEKKKKKKKKKKQCRKFYIYWIFLNDSKIPETA